MLDQFVQTQLRTKSSGGAYASQRASFHDQLQRIYGQPGSTTTFDALFNDFTTAAQALATSPDSALTRTGLLGAAQALAQQLNIMTSSIQTLRSQADLGISNDVVQVNQALQKIASINQQLATGGADDNTATVLKDQRDLAIDQLAKLMDIRVVQGANNQVTVYSGAGFQLVGNEASRLAFTATGTITPSMLWNADPTKSDLGTISLIGPDGAAIDLLAAGGIRSGELAAYVEMRDRTLVQAQGQLDELAAQMSKALSDLTTNGTAVTVGPNAGFTVDIANLSPGNTVQITYTDASSVQHRITVVRVEDPAALPLSDSLTADPNDRVVGISFVGGAAAVAARLTTALGSTGLQFSNPSGSLLQVLNGGLATTVDTLSATATMTSFTSGNPQLPLFTDATRAVHRGHHRRRHANDRLRRPDRGQPRALYRSDQAGDLSDSSADAAGRCHTAELHQRSAHQRLVPVRPRDRHRRIGGAVRRDAVGVHRAGRRLPGPGRERGDQSQGRPGDRRQCPAAALHREVGRQHRPGNVAAAHVAERLWGQCARDDDREADVRYPFADVMQQM